jgi:hypothetical protein
MKQFFVCFNVIQVLGKQCRQSSGQFGHIPGALYIVCGYVTLSERNEIQFLVGTAEGKGCCSFLRHVLLEGITDDVILYDLKGWSLI